MAPRWYQMLDREERRGFWTTYAGFTLDAMDIQLYAFVLPLLIGLWGLTFAQAGMLATFALAASAAGGWIAGLLSDRLGRVRILKVSILWLAIATCLCGLARDFDQLLVARALQGIGFGGEWAVGAVYVAELAAPETRARMVGTIQSAWAIGWGLAAAMSAVLLSLLPLEIGWRVTFAVGFVPAMIVFVARLRVRESKTYARAKQAHPWHAIFARPMLSLTARGAVLASGMHSGYWAIATWWPAMLSSERGFSVATISGYFGVLVTGSLAGYGAAAWLGDMVGRRFTLVGFALGGVLMVLAGTALAPSDFMLLVLGFPLGFFALGMFSVIGPLLSELYPTQVRGSGLGFCYNFGRAIAGSTPLLIGGSAASFGISRAIGLHVACAYCVVIVAALLLPETRGKKLASAA